MDIVVMMEKEKKEEKEKRRKVRFAINAKPNPYTTPITHHDTITPSPRTKAEMASEKKGERVTDWVSVSEPVPFFFRNTNLTANIKSQNPILIK